MSSFLWLWTQGGWDVERWRKAHPWTPAHSEQSEHKELFPIAADITRERWERQRERWAAISQQLVGQVSDKPPATMRHEFLTEPLTLPGRPAVAMRRLRFTLTDHEWGYAWLLTPQLGKGGDRPAVITLHQTVIQGKDEPVGLEGEPGYPSGMDYGLSLAREGLTVLAPDAIGFGERAAEHSNAFYRSSDQFFAAHPDGSVMAKMVFAVSRAVDLLQRLPNIDPNHIGCIGHSHGGYGTIFAMIGEPRLKAAAVSCGFTTLRSDPSPERWWRRTALIPRLAFYEGQIERVPIDFHLWLALIAPRPLFVSTGLNDGVFPGTDNLPRVMTMLKPVWEAHGAADRLRSRVFPGPHDFPGESRRQAFALLREALEM
jgi:dienelactone hydrolase